MRFPLHIARPALPRLFLLLVTLLLAGPGRGWAQAPPFTQAVSLNHSGGSSSSESFFTGTDAAGNQLVTGQFTGNLVLGSTTLVSAGGRDVFVAKRNATTGAWLWAVRAGGSIDDYAYGVAMDAGGNALVAGYFQLTASFATSPVATNLVSEGGTDIFVAKFGASTGTCAWAIQAGGSGNDEGKGVAVDIGGNAFVTGNFTDTASFTVGFSATTLTSAGLKDVFVAKFEASTGSCAWVAKAGGSTDDLGHGVAVDASGNAFVTGSFTTTASFYTGSPPTALTSAGLYDIFVAKFRASTGACAWAVRVGDSRYDSGGEVTVDRSGNAVVTGYFSGMASFATAPTATALTSAGDLDVFVAKFGTNSGTCAWAVRAGGSGADVGNGVAVDGAGNALVTGYFQTTANFATSPTATSLTSAGGYDVFVAKFGANTGACAWAVRAGGSADDLGSSVALDGSGNALLAGFFQGSASFGSFILVGSSSSSLYTGYLVVMAGAGTLPTAAPSPLPAFTLAPNPARSTCQIQGAAAGAAVVLLDALGRPLARALADASGTARLALPAGLAPGLYLVRSGGQLRRLAVE